MIAVLTPCTAPHSSSAETSRPQISVPGSNLRLLRRYYYGNRNDIQRAGVQNILRSVMLELEWTPDRKFSYVEQAYFMQWWAEQPDDMRSLVRQLVASGQLEFLNGAWSMHDEACPGFADMIDQTSLGHRLIKEEFGVAVRTTQVHRVRSTAPIQNVA